MKKAPLFPVLFISSTLMVSACTPKDVPVTSPDVRNRIIEQNNRKNGGGKKIGASSEFRIGGFSSVAVLMDRQIEALEVIRLATAKERAEKTQYQVGQRQSSEIKELNGYSIELTSQNEALNYTTDRGEFKTTLAKKWKVDVFSKDDKVVSIKAVADKSITITDKLKAAKKSFLNVYENKIELNMKKIEAQTGGDLYEVVVTSDGNLIGTLDDNRNKAVIKSEIKFKIDGRDLDGASIKVLDLEGFIVVTPEQGKETKSTINNASNTVNAEGSCNYVSGKIKFKSGDAEKQMILDDKKIIVEGSKYQISLAECSRRPTIDYTRLFIW